MLEIPPCSVVNSQVLFTLTNLQVPEEQSRTELRMVRKRKPGRIQAGECESLQWMQAQSPSTSQQ